MAKMVFTKAHVDINTVDRSSNVSKVEVDDTFEDVDMTTYGDDGKKTRLAGLEDGSCPITFKNDFAAGELDSAMWALRGTLTTVNVWPDRSAVVSSANPRYSASILINAWKPIAGNVGSAAEVDVTFPVSGGWTRYTTT